MLVTAALIIALLGAEGVLFGFVLACANRKFAVEMDPRIHEIEELLPKGQCGACGFAGCLAYAEAVVLRPDVPPDLCIPGKAAAAAGISALTGKKAENKIPMLAHVRCANPISSNSVKYKYSGIRDCTAASLLQLGPKDCQYGCIGFGSCVRSCPFGAIRLTSQRLPIINRKRCAGCGKCADACPKKIIEMVPANVKVWVKCNSRNKAADARRHCPVPCLGCGVCAKNCPHGAIKTEGNLAWVDAAVCLGKCRESSCLEKCPTGAIKAAVFHRINSAPPRQ